MNRLLRFREILPKLRYSCIPFDNTKCTCKTIQASRSIMSRVSEKLESKLKSRDMIPEDFELVYRGGMDNYVLLCQWGWLTFMALGTGSLYSMIVQDTLVQFPVPMGTSSIILLHNYTQLAFSYVVFFAMTFALRLISVRYVLRMYYNPKTSTYRIVQNGIFPTYTRTLDFQAGTLKRIKKTTLVPWWNIQYICNGTKILIFDYGFRTSADYDRMFEG